jgi:hypothetical protein
MGIEGRIAALGPAGDPQRWTITVRVSAAFQPRIEPVAQHITQHVGGE